MAVAVVSHAALRNHALMIGFPLRTKVKCESGLNGYQIWDTWIRENVFWVIETAFDPQAHVKVTESAQLIGELKDPWELRCQKFLEGDENYNTFRSLNDEGETFQTHVNRQAIQVAVSNTMFKYKVDFETDESGAVITHNALAVAIFDAAEDSSLSYTSDIEVAQLWTTKIEHNYPAGDDTDVAIPLLFMRAYANDPLIEDAYPWLLVGELTQTEYEEWKEHNIKPETLLDDVPLDVRAIDERSQAQLDTEEEAFDEHCHQLELNEKASMAYDNPISSFTKESIRLPDQSNGLTEHEVFGAFNETPNIAERIARHLPESFTAISKPANLPTILRDKSPEDRDYFNAWTGERDHAITSVSHSDTSSSDSSGGSSD